VLSLGIIAALTREHGGWEQARLRTSDERSRVKCLVPAQGAGARHLAKSAPRFRATQSRGTMKLSGGCKRHPLERLVRR